jgi:hypothetical protein
MILLIQTGKIREINKILHAELRILSSQSPDDARVPREAV